MTTAVLLEPPGAVPNKTLEEIKRETARLEIEKLSKNARSAVSRIHARVEELQQQLAPYLASLSPQKVGERIVAELQIAEGGAWSGLELKEKFNLTPAVLHRRRKEKRIVYWRDARHDFFYPRWQFTESGATLPGIQEVLQIFRSEDEWRVMRYFLGTRKQLSNRRPLDMLRSGETEKVIAHARDHAAENTW